MKLTLEITRSSTTYRVLLFPEDASVPYVALEGRNLIDLMRGLGTANVWKLVDNSLRRDERE